MSCTAIRHPVTETHRPILQAATITDEDIDTIIQKGAAATEDLNNKMKDFTENAMKFTLDGGIAYDFKDPEEEEEPGVDYKSLIGACLLGTPQI